jgi:cytochrome b561
MNKKYSTLFRIMHWSIALCMMFMLFTIFLRLNWMNKNHMAGIISAELANLDIQLGEEESVLIAKKIRKPMWEWHIWIGYVLIGLYVLRLILAAFKKMIIMNPFAKNISSKERFQAWLYISFYLFMAMTLFTGFMVVNGPDNLHELMEDLHKPSLYYILAFVFIHISGILWSEFTNDKGIISRVIGGGK